MLTKSKYKKAGLATAACLLLGLSASEAAVVITMTESGPNVMAVGSGSLNLTGLSGPTTFGNTPRVDPDSVLIAIGNTTNKERRSASGGITGPANLGPGTSAVNATSSTGDHFGFDTSSSRVYMPFGYLSGSSLSGTSTWVGQSFAGLGLTPGTYVYTIAGSGDTFTLNIGAGAVPEPGRAALMLLGLCGITLRRRRSR